MKVRKSAGWISLTFAVARTPRLSACFIGPRSEVMRPARPDHADEEPHVRQESLESGKARPIPPFLWGGFDAFLGSLSARLGRLALTRTLVRFPELYC
jgi:hypothetical protein